VEGIMAWDPDHIDFISEYCDRWCERCPLTHKCATFTRESDPEELEAHSEAVEDAMEALRVELALPDTPGRGCAESMWMTPDVAEETDTEVEGDASRQSVRDHPLMVEALDYSVDAFTWLKLYGEATRARAAGVVTEHPGSEEGAVLRMEAERVVDALDVVRWDSMLIAAKLRRALVGKADGGQSFCSDPAQTDWNGSAKLTLILVERSEAGWRLIRRWAPESDIANQLADTLASIRVAVERAFPLAGRFIRPGFDEPQL
jgi:hypothetical protein